MKVNTYHLKKVTFDHRFPEFTVGTPVAMKTKPDDRLGIIGRVMTDDYMVVIGIDTDFGNPRCALAELLVPHVAAA